jgi:hypothetical protein
MSLLPPHLATAPLDPKAHWITPEEQLELLDQAKPFIIEKIRAASTLVKDLANLVAEYAEESRLTSWYNGLKTIKKLPPKIPPLPEHIRKILNNRCPKQICDKMKSDGSFYTIGEKCTLTLVPEELENINKFQTVVKSHREMQDPKDGNLLQFDFFLDTAQAQYGDVAFEPTHWELQTDVVLARSTNWENQAAAVDALAKETSVGWEVPELRGTLAAIFIKNIATGESIYQAGNQQNGNVSTSTRVKEMTGGHHLVVGVNDSPSAFVEDYDNYDLESIGIAARLSSLTLRT